jgi:hypothetical protein
MILARLTLLACAGLVTACAPPSDDGDVDAGETCTKNADCKDRGFCIDGKCEPCDFGLPAPNDVCLPKCGNERGVGQPCTKGGGECNAWLAVSGGAGICTIDFVSDADLHMCTRPCADDVDCGADAVCQGDPNDPGGDKGCVPQSCS